MHGSSFLICCGSLRPHTQRALTLLLELFWICAPFFCAHTAFDQRWLDAKCTDLRTRRKREWIKVEWILQIFITLFILVWGVNKQSYREKKILFHFQCLTALFTADEIYEFYCADVVYAFWRRSTMFFASLLKCVRNINRKLRVDVRGDDDDDDGGGGGGDSTVDGGVRPLEWAAPVLLPTVEVEPPEMWCHSQQSNTLQLHSTHWTGNKVKNCGFICGNECSFFQSRWPSYSPKMSTSLYISLEL